jgi:GT2 family glycosyltransferase
MLCGQSAELTAHSLNIIIPVLNNLSFTQKMLKSLTLTLPQNLVVELIIVDDASSDGTSEWLASLNTDVQDYKQFKSIKILTNTSVLGYSKSNNLAAQHANGELLVLLNNDLVFEPGWLEPMLGMFVGRLTSPMVVGNLQYQPKTGALDHAGVEVRLTDDASHPVIDHMLKITDGKPYKVFAVTGACCLIARQTFELLGGFDEGYENGCEDIDLCLKVREMGGTCWIVPNSKVWHHVSQTRGKNEYRDKKNSLRLFEKWHQQIAIDLEKKCAEVFLNTFQDDPQIKNMVIDFIAGHRSLAPIAVKVMTRKITHSVLSKN